MNDTEIINRLSELLGDLLGDDTIKLTPETTRSDVPDWDSFQYVNFIVAVEVEFGIQFNVADAESFDTIADVVAEIQSLKG